MTPRRRVLVTLGTTGIAGIAGCAQLSGDDSNESADPNEESSDDSENVDSENADSEDDDSFTEPEDASGEALRVTDSSLDPVPARQTDVVELSLSVVNESADTVDADFVFHKDSAEFDSKSQSIPPGETTTVSTQRELIRVGDHQFEATIEQGGSPVANAETSVSVGQFPASFVGVEGTDFTLDDGTFYVAGADTNSSLTVAVSHPDHEQLRPLMFDALDRIGATVLRLFPEVSTPVELGGPFPGEDNETFFKRFDMTITEAKRRNIRVSIPIISGIFQGRDPDEHFANHIPAYVHRAETADEYDDFYRNQECIDLYKQWVKEFLTHENHLTGVEYRHDPTIMMWELGNEIRWKEGWKRDSDTLRPWIEEVGPYVKELAPDQLLTTGIYGWPRGRNNFVEDHRPDCIDVCSLHYYVGPAGYDLTEEEAEEVLDQKIEEAHETLEKPLWLGEYNWGHPDHPNTPKEFSDAFLKKRNSKLRKWHNRLDEGDVAGASVHQVNSKKVVEELVGYPRTHTSIYPSEETGTASELRRYARITREKSTASAVPELNNLDG